MAKKVVTMDPSWPTGNAIAVQNGVIVSVGSLKDMDCWIKTSQVPHEIDCSFADKVIVPGFIEPHIHQGCYR